MVRFNIHTSNDISKRARWYLHSLVKHNFVVVVYRDISLIDETYNVCKTQVQTQIIKIKIKVDKERW